MGGCASVSRGVASSEAKKDSGPVPASASQKKHETRRDSKKLVERKAAISLDLERPSDLEVHSKADEEEAPLLSRRLAFSKEASREVVERRRTQLKENVNVSRRRWSEEEEANDIHPSDEEIARIDQKLSEDFLFGSVPAGIRTDVIKSMVQKKFMPGQTIIHQGADVDFTEDGSISTDFVYLIDQGTADIVVHGEPPEQAYQLRGESLDALCDLPISPSDGTGPLDDGEDPKRIVAQKSAGEVFGELALLLSCPRSADVVASSELKTWALSRTEFTRLLLQYSYGTSVLRFLREVPLLQNLPDHLLSQLAQRVRERTFHGGEVIVAAGTHVPCLSVVCEGTVKLTLDNSWSNTYQQEINLSPTKQSFVELYVEQYEFFGERELQHPECRSVATATAVGAVKLMQIDKREFDLCLPLLTLVLNDYLKINALTRCAFLKDLTTIQKENVVDKFCINTFNKGDFLCREGEMGYTFFILKSGKVTIFKEDAQLCSVVHVAHPYESFGELALMNNSERTASCVASSEKVECLTLMRQHFETLLGPLRAVLARNAHEKILKQCKQLKALPEEDLKVLARQFQEEEYTGGDVIITEGEVGDKFFVVLKGEVVITKTLLDGTKKELLRLKEGSEFGERALLYDEPRAASVIATEDTTCIYITRMVFEKHLGPLKDFMERHVQELEKRSVELKLRFKDLRLGRILGTGMYGHVRQAVHKYTNEVYALKTVPKANVVEARQQQHVQNERIVCELADHWSCCRMKRCFQNNQKVFFLLEFVQGGELFRLLSKKRRFALPMATFYAANVVLALEHLHSKVGHPTRAPRRRNALALLSAM